MLKAVPPRKVLVQIKLYLDVDEFPSTISHADFVVLFSRSSVHFIAECSRERDDFGFRRVLKAFKLPQKSEREAKPDINK